MQDQITDRIHGWMRTPPHVGFSQLIQAMRDALATVLQFATGVGNETSNDFLMSGIQIINSHLDLP